MRNTQKLCHLQHNHIIQIRGILFRDIFPFQLPTLFVALDSHADFIVPVLPVDCLNGFCQCRLLLPVHLIKEIPLDSVVTADTPNDYTGFLVMIVPVLFPITPQHLDSRRHQFLMIVRWNRQIGRCRKYERI